MSGFLISGGAIGNAKCLYVDCPLQSKILFRSDLGFNPDRALQPPGDPVRLNVHTL